MEAVKIKGKGKKKSKTVKSPKTQQILPNPDEVIEIERPGSVTSTHSKPELFTGDSDQSTSAANPKNTDETGLGSTLSLTKPSQSRPISPLSLPFKSAQVVPLNDNQNGSQVSMRSRTSKEAWKGEEIKPDVPARRLSTHSKTAAVKDVLTSDTDKDASMKSRSGSTTDMLSPPKLKGEEQAYVPYVFARDTIVRIVNDMHKMRESHITVIGQIELNYRMIEDETQRQFNSFVLNLRSVYKDKLSVFQHVIGIHRKDTEKKQEYWDSKLVSMSAQNKKLLTDKKALLIQNKLLIDRLAEVREEERRNMATQIDALNIQMENQAKQHSEELEKEHEERQQKEKELNDEIERLQSLPVQEDATPSSAVIVATEEGIERQTLQTEAMEPQIVTKEVMIDMSESERAELTAERQRISEEMADMTKQREALEKEREEFISDRKKLNEENELLQKKITESEKGIAEWKGKYELTNTQLSQFGCLRIDYDNLLAAYNAMVVVASDIGKADEKLEKGKSDKASLEEDKKELENDVAKWEAEFKQRTGRDPTEDDQPDSIKEFKVMLRETDNAITKIDIEMETVTALKNGEAPEPPKSSPEAEKAVIPAEPVIKIVEVKVPDPEVVSKLTAAEEKNDKLQKDNANLQIKIDTLQQELASLKDKVSALETQLKKVEAENASNIKTIEKLNEKIKEQKKLVKQAEVKSAQGDVTKQETVELTAAAVVATGEDHTDCQEKIEKLELKIESLEEQLLEAKSGLADTTDTTTVVDTDKIDELQVQVDQLEEKLRVEINLHKESKEEIETLEAKIKELEEQLETGKKDQEEVIGNATLALNAQLSKKEKELKAAQDRVADLEAKMLENVPVDTAAEMKKLMKKIATLTKDNELRTKKAAEMEAKSKELETEKNSLTKQLDKEKQTNSQNQTKIKAAKEENEKEISKLTVQWDKKEKTRVAENKAKVEALNKKIKELESRPAAPAAKGKADAGDAKSQKQIAALTEQLQEKKKENKDLQAKITQLQDDVKKAKAESGGDVKEQKKQEKILKEMSKKLDMETKKAERDGAKVKELESELTTIQKDRDSKETEIKKLKTDIDQLGVTAAQAMELTDKVKSLEEEVKHLNKETQRLSEAYQTERVQRKKYFNMVEDMKGKIRVYCRARPMSQGELGRGNFSILQSPDEYSIHVESSRGLKEFNFDRIFMPDHSQQQVFEDTYHLVQSAVDGYNVCIFAYGQTGSGKTFTMIGDQEQKFPGIAPRAFKRIFELIEENKEKFNFKVSSYMLELYNDKLLDLYGGKDSTPDDKMDIKKDKAGLVFVKGAVVKEANTEEALYNLFEEGSKNRHVASTKMNAESSRSHLILSIIIEATNKMNGQVNKGKLSLVDLAGSERVGKTGASAETLKEANSINKSLAALGDVISALSSDQQFIPYRNNKLTMLMQDSLGGNAKTLMFVNISPADYNADETVTSLTYASRVKLITNDAQKNQDNKEIARLKAMIDKLKSGENVDEADEQ